MGFLNDYKEFREGRKSKKLSWKIISILGLILAINSFASLSDAIIKFRGILKDTLEFYDKYYVGNILLFFETYSPWKISLSKDSINILTTYYLFFGPISVFILRRNNPRETSIHRFFNKLVGIMVFVLPLFILFPVRDYSKEFVTPGLNILNFCLISGPLILAGIYSTVHSSRPYLVKPIITILVVILLAVINKGITTPI